MHRCLKKLLPFWLLLLTISGLIAQDFTDSRSTFYEDARRWYIRGYVDALPAMIPYTLQQIQQILTTAKDRAPESEQNQIQSYLSHFEKDAQMSLGYFTDVRAGSPGSFVATGPRLNFQGFFSPEVAIMGQFIPFAKDHEEEPFIRAASGPTYNVFEDQADLTLFGRDLDLRMMFLNNLSVVLGDFSIQTGIMAPALGTELGSGILGGEQYPSPSFSAQYDTEFFDIGMQYLSLTASDYLGRDQFGEKHMVINNYSFRPFDWLNFNAYEVAIYGNRFDLSYFVPLSFMFYTQNFSGFGDNSGLGGSMDVRIPGNVFWSSELFIDDAHLNNLIRLKFDGKTKIVAQSGVSWHPDIPFLRELKASYLAITPYTYSQVGDRFSPLLSRHGDIKDDFDGVDDDTVSSTYAEYEDEILSQANFLNYSHYGRSLGSQLKPNSDQIKIAAEISILPNLSVSLDSRFIRHGNPNEGITNNDWRPGQGSLDGTIFDDGFDDEFYETFKDETRFLTQSVLEYTSSTELEVRYGFRWNNWLVNIGAGVLVEMVWNQNFIEGSEANESFGFGALEFSYVF